MTAASSKRMTFQEYIAFEEASELRHEFYKGEIFAMAGGTPEHAALCTNILAALGQLKGPCRAFNEALRIRTASGKVCYPDATVICGAIARDPDNKNTVTNPTMIVEVLSEGTEGYDRGDKFTHYRSCPSFVEYVLVASQGEPRIERFVKTNGVWTICDHAGLGQAQRLSSIDLALDVDAIYEGLVDKEGNVRVL